MKDELYKDVYELLNQIYLRIEFNELYEEIILAIIAMCGMASLVW